jgi:tRNA threonylcarbamoyladenosine biosynthesis protein TsaE
MAEETLTFFSDGPDATFRLGSLLGKEALGGEVIALIGDLGAGKTRLVQGLAQGLGVSDSYVNSPTFILVQVHEGRLPLYHIDLYRLESGAEISAIGFEEYLEGEGVAAVEWADKGMSLFPSDRLTIEIHYGQESERKIILTGQGPKSRAWLDKIRSGVSEVK